MLLAAGDVLPSRRRRGNVERCERRRQHFLLINHHGGMVRSELIAS